MSDVLLGVIIGGIITAITNWITTYMQIKQKESDVNQTYNLERDKLAREHDLKRLNLFLKPALIIYGKNRTFIEIGSDKFDITFGGNGVSREYALELIKLVENHLEYVDLDIWYSYFKVKGNYDYDYMSFEQGLPDYGGDNIEYNIFDDTLEMYKKVKKRAEELEKKYT